MALASILHMNTGDGESSYANNSLLQETGIRKALPLLRKSIKAVADYDVHKGCFSFADFGCSSGTNTLLVASSIIDIVHEMCQENNHKVPQFQVCMNDLFGNDFNAIFKLLPDFYAKLRKDKEESFGPCFVSAVPGSFYDRLFADQSLHLAHAANANHWLSQVPTGLENNGSNIYMAKTSPPNVFLAYGKQFHTDFTKFLQLRSEELVLGGSMILTLPCRSIVDPTSDDSVAINELLAQSLVDLSNEGLVQESDIISFNMPVYLPCEEEVRNIIEHEGSFSIEDMNFFKVNWDPHDTDYTNMNDSSELSQIHGENTSKLLRAIIEPLLISHFGNSIIDMLFKKFGKHENGIRQAVPLLKHLIKGLANHDVLSDRFTFADLGCSSGTNTLLVASNIIDMVHEVCQENERKVPQFQLRKDKGESFGPCFVSAVPGSFYDRLFPDQSLHLVHSANSNHWLSQVPQGLENNGTYICMAKKSPPNVYQAYRNQFHTDFTKFLKMRSEEVVHGGSMIITFLARGVTDPTADDSWALLELLGQSLVDLIKEGLVRESDINSFNVPLYFPCEEELKNIIEHERSFSLENMNFLKLNWDPQDTDYMNMNESDELSQIHGKNVSKLMKAILEPLLISHFGNSIIDMLFKKLEKHVAEYLTKKKPRSLFVTISVTRK
ncbi:hypothetical protein M8C21_009475 [Ambrosia artemisiifolia]|uniref:Uncharacterized protein n=1 Tax=Ambrosia artemisiifolia TaxID=4212 RepID=A0AAD5DAS5_AMBAR|nr:hypothetical protein M8C21_009475 [Ambrosia artemisiifolia]